MEEKKDSHAKIGDTKTNDKDKILFPPLETVQCGWHAHSLEY